ncbi:MAG: class I lanthipeptide [Thermoanaerobaculia bacterium]
MKRKIQKLSLTKETLRSLEDPSLNQVAGGATTQPDTCPVVSCNVCTDVTRRCSACCGS